MTRKREETFSRKKIGEMDLYWQELEEDYYDYGEINEEAIIALKYEKSSLALID